MSGQIMYYKKAVCTEREREREREREFKIEAIKRRKKKE